MEAGGANNLVLIGGGGHALVVGEAAFDSGWTVAGFYDDRADAPLSGLAPRLGGIAELLAATMEFRFGWLVLLLMPASARSTTSTPASLACKIAADCVPAVSCV